MSETLEVSPDQLIFLFLPLRKIKNIYIIIIKNVTLTREKALGLLLKIPEWFGCLLLGLGLRVRVMVRSHTANETIGKR